MARKSGSLAPVVCGVYILFKDREVVYVGRSNDCYERITSHRNNGRAFDYAIVAATPDYDAPWIEQALIKALDASQNRSGRNRAGQTDPSFPLYVPVYGVTSKAAVSPVISAPKAREIAAGHGMSSAEATTLLASDAVKKFPTGQLTMKGRPVLKYDSASVIAACQAWVEAKCKAPE